jgi:hypothetical protein
MPADGRWDLIRRLKGQYTYLTTVRQSELIHLGDSDKKNGMPFLSAGHDSWLKVYHTEANDQLHVPPIYL